MNQWLGHWRIVFLLFNQEELKYQANN